MAIAAGICDGLKYGDNAKANALIKADNPEMTDAQIAFSIAAMKQYGIVDSVIPSRKASASAALKGAASLSGPAGGLIASLLRAPEGKAVALNGRVDGTITNFTGTASLAFEDEQEVVARANGTRFGLAAGVDWRSGAYYVGADVRWHDVRQKNGIEYDNTAVGLKVGMNF